MGNGFFLDISPLTCFGCVLNVCWTLFQVGCPAGSCQKLKSFHRLLILRAMRPDRLLDALTSYIGATLGEDYVSEPPFDMEATWKETSRATPIFFVLFPGVDPTLWVEALGKKYGKTMVRVLDGFERPMDKRWNKI